MDTQELNLKLELHGKWLLNQTGGRQLDLHNMNLHAADLHGINLSNAKLYGIDLSGANLRNANLCGAQLYDANMSGAVMNCAHLYGANMASADLSCACLSRAGMGGVNLSDAHLFGTNFRGADLSNADLSGANMAGAALTGAVLDRVKYDTYTSFYSLTCPETGAFLGYKKASGYIVQLEICADAKRSSATTRKCRCSAAKVLSITCCDGRPVSFRSVVSDHDFNFVYPVGQIVSVPDFDEDRWHECSNGIHFFLTRDEAVRY